MDDRKHACEERVHAPTEGDELGIVEGDAQGRVLRLALEARVGDEEIAELAANLTHPDSLVCLTAERALVTALDATYRTPVAAYARLESGALVMDAFVGLPDGSAWIRDELEGDPEDPAALGLQIAQRLIPAGAEDLLAQAEHAAP